MKPGPFATTINKIHAALFTGAVIFALLTHAAVSAEKQSTSKYVLCRNNKTIRTIRLEQDSNDNKCVAVYTKEGIDQEVGRAQSAASCNKIVDGIKGNLEGANWKCREYTGVQITTTQE